MEQPELVRMAVDRRARRSATIRRARPEEASALSALAWCSKAHWGYDAAFLERCGAELAVTEADVARGNVTVAERDGALLGFAALSLDAPAELEALFVEPAAMGQGVGAALVEHARSAARRAGVDALLVESDPNAEAFYRRQGAEPVGERRSPTSGRRLPLLRLPT